MTLDTGLGTDRLVLRGAVTPVRLLLVLGALQKKVGYRIVGDLFYRFAFDGGDLEGAGRFVFGQPVDQVSELIAHRLLAFHVALFFVGKREDPWLAKSCSSCNPMMRCISGKSPISRAAW